MKRAVWFATLCALMLVAREAPAHRFAAGVLDVRGSSRRGIITLRAPRAALAIIDVQLPARCTLQTPRGRLLAQADGSAGNDPRDSATTTRRYRCAGRGILGATLRLRGLSAAGLNVVARVDVSGISADGTRKQSLLTTAAPTLRIGRPATSGQTWALAGRYVRLGVEHILLGIDHLAFVACLLLLVGQSRRRLLQTITAFTVGHSVTLSLAALGLLSLPSAPTEALIALSIVLLAREALYHRRDAQRAAAGSAAAPLASRRITLARRRPWLVAAAFGLLHGLGFAGALSEIGLPARAVPLALASFNVGVELGQLMFVAVALAAVAALARLMASARSPRVARVALYALGSVAGFWLAERVVSVFA